MRRRRPDRVLSFRTVPLPQAIRKPRGTGRGVFHFQQPRWKSARLSLDLRFFGWNDGVLQGLGDTELDDLLGRDLDLLAGGGIAPDARLALLAHEPADAGQNEQAVLLGFAGRHF